MEVISRVNVFLAIMFIVLITDHVVSSLIDEDDIVGQAFEILATDGVVSEDKELKVTDKMKTLIAMANKKYLEGDITGSKESFNELMKLRVEAGGILPIGEFNKLSAEYSTLKLRVYDNDAGFFILNGEGGIIAEKVEDLSKVIKNQNPVFISLFYIFVPDKLSSIIIPDKGKKWMFDRKYYYYHRDNGKLKLNRFNLFWFDTEIRNIDLKNKIITERVNEEINKRKINVLLNNKYLYNSRMEKSKRTLFGRAIDFMEGNSLI